jgi:hypothetical protein
MIIKEQESGTNNNMLDFKSLCQTSNSYKHLKVSLEEVSKYDRNRSGGTTEQLFNIST